MKRKKQAVAIALSAVLACGALAGCDALTTHDNAKDYAQTVATVDISKSKAFTEEGGEFYGLGLDEFIGETVILKRQLVQGFLSTGQTLVQYYGMSFADAFDYIMDSLVQRQINVQYAKAFLAKENNLDANAYTTAVAEGGESYYEKQAAGLGFFLDQEEKDKAQYDLRVSVNSQIDTIEEGIIDVLDEHEHTPDSEVRTLPTGAETENEDYYDTEYAIYTGLNKAEDCGSYEAVDGSLPSTRKKAYKEFVSRLYSNNYIEKGENTRNFEETSYYFSLLASQYETAVIDKMEDALKDEATANLTEDWAQAHFDETLDNQTDLFNRDRSSFETAFDGMSDTSFILTAPKKTNNEYEAYGYVINILLPFSDAQSKQLENASQDYNDPKGGKYATRTKLLEKLTATDQRGTWFTGHTDYSYLAEEGDKAFTNNDDVRKYLFFEDNFGEGNTRYQRVKNYLGQYTYNGEVVLDDDGDIDYLVPNKINIGGFLNEVKGYLEFATDHTLVPYNGEAANPDEYFSRSDYLNEDRTDYDYEKFIYEKGKVDWDGGFHYNANEMFVAGTEENQVLSVINELSFAYNTDTAGLNTYLGYSVTPNKTDYVSEYEYAAQWAVRNGAGSYAVVPSQFGWHFIYCTFSFADYDPEGNNAFSFDYEKREDEDTFSYLFFEQLKSDQIETYVSKQFQKFVKENKDDSATIDESKFSDLKRLGD